MDYRVFDLKSSAPLDTLELHVLARAYFAAWRAVHRTTPESRHPMPMFNAFFDFYAPPMMSARSSDNAAQPVDADQHQ
jgi:hypothetical protein